MYGPRRPERMKIHGVNRHPPDPGDQQVSRSDPGDHFVAVADVAGHRDDNRVAVAVERLKFGAGYIERVKMVAAIVEKGDSIPAVALRATIAVETIFCPGACQAGDRYGRPPAMDRRRIAADKCGEFTERDV